MGEPEGWPHEGAKKRELKKSLWDLWGQAVPTPIGAGTACPRTTRRNLLHTSEFLRCCDWPRRHSRAPAELNPAHLPPFIQPSLRDSNISDALPGVETPGYFREVPPGLQCPAKTMKFRKVLRLKAFRTLRFPLSPREDRVGREPERGVATAPGGPAGRAALLSTRLPLS
jgi:hypothetical protein